MEVAIQEPLLPRVARGDSAAIQECLQRYGGLVWSLARRLSPTPTDAEDATQEIFIELWKNADRFRAEVASESTFVAMLARRRLIDRRRKQTRRLDTQSIGETATEIAAPPIAPRLELAEDASQAAECLERLRSDERRVLELSIYHGLPQPQIAERTGLALGTVKTHARRGLLQLRDCMSARERVRGEGGASR